jgi:hypothetical protein
MSLQEQIAATKIQKQLADVVESKLKILIKLYKISEMKVFEVTDPDPQGVEYLMHRQIHALGKPAYGFKLRFLPLTNRFEILVDKYPGPWTKFDKE